MTERNDPLKLSNLILLSLLTAIPFIHVSSRPGRVRPQSPLSFYPCNRPSLTSLDVAIFFDPHIYVSTILVGVSNTCCLLFRVLLHSRTPSSSFRDLIACVHYSILQSRPPQPIWNFCSYLARRIIVYPSRSKYNIRHSQETYR